MAAANALQQILIMTTSINIPHTQTTAIHQVHWQQLMQTPLQSTTCSLICAPLSLLTAISYLPLSPAEHQRMQQFRQQADQQRYGLAHRLKRALLAHTLDCDPLALTFSLNAAGKPALSPPHDKVQFNLSHSGPIVTIALSLQGAVGCDIQFMLPGSSQVALPTEMLYHPVDPTDPNPQKRFFSCWTQKEAISKAEGSGLQILLTQLPLYSSKQRSTDNQPCSGITNTKYWLGTEQHSHSEWQQQRWYCRHREVRYGKMQGWLAVAQARLSPVQYYLLSGTF
jgi:4'-phosphopantetheinyl transferase